MVPPHGITPQCYSSVSLVGCAEPIRKSGAGAAQRSRVVLTAERLLEPRRYAKTRSAPDAPFTTFETVLPAGPHSALTANVAERKHFELCGETLEMPTTITGQNGSVIEHDTRITIQGCAAVKAAKAKRLTNAQKLAKALAACRKRNKHARRKRVACVRHARKEYGQSKKTKKKRK